MSPIKKIEEKMSPLVSAAGTLGLFIVIAFAVVSITAYKIKSFDNTLAATGSAKVKVTADLGKWNLNFSRTVSESNMKAGIDRMSLDLEEIKKFLKENGIADDEFVVSPVFSDKVYKYYEKGAPAGPDEYTFRQTVEVKSKDTGKIRAVAANAKSLFETGLLVSPSSPEYYYTALAEKRTELIGEAVKDARRRAEMIAENDNRKVGNLRSASIGVTQVLAADSVDVSDYGTYDTSTEDKDVMVTVRAVFRIK